MPKRNKDEQQPSTPAVPSVSSAPLTRRQIREQSALSSLSSVSALEPGDEPRLEARRINDPDTPILTRRQLRERREREEQEAAARAANTIADTSSFPHITEPIAGGEPKAESAVDHGSKPSPNAAQPPKIAPAPAPPQRQPAQRRGPQTVPPSALSASGGKYLDNLPEVLPSRRELRETGALGKPIAAATEIQPAAPVEQSPGTPKRVSVLGGQNTEQASAPEAVEQSAEQPAVRPTAGPSDDALTVSQELRAPSELTPGTQTPLTAASPLVPAEATRQEVAEVAEIPWSKVTPHDEDFEEPASRFTWLHYMILVVVGLIFGTLIWLVWLSVNEDTPETETGATGATTGVTVEQTSGIYSSR